MSRDSYDDLENSDRRRGGKPGKTGLIVSVIILFVLLILVLFLLLLPSSNKEIVGNNENTNSSENETNASLQPSSDFFSIILSRYPYIKEIYENKNNETISFVASLYSLKEETLLDVNKRLKVEWMIDDEFILIPFTDGFLYKVVDPSLTISEIIEKTNTNYESNELLEINGLSKITLGDLLFIPYDEKNYVFPFSKIIYPYSSLYKGKIIPGIVFSTKASEGVFSISKCIVEEIGKDNTFGKYVRVIDENECEITYYGLEVIDVDEKTTVEKNVVLGSAPLINPYFEESAILITVKKDGSYVDPTLL